MLRISLLGEQVIEDDATGEIRSGSSRTLALVGYLALHAGTPQSRQVMAGLFWPESTDAPALNKLRRQRHFLRRVREGDGSRSFPSTSPAWPDPETCPAALRGLRTSVESARRSGD